MAPSRPTITLLFALVAMSVAPARSRAEVELPEKRILVLHSYERGNRYEQLQEASIEDVLMRADDMRVTILLEHMNCWGSDKDISAQQDLLQQLYAVRYKDNPIDLIITTDTRAFKFMRDRGELIFPDVPVVFSAVTEPYWQLQFNGRPMSGVVEQLDVRGTIETALHIQPDLRKLIIVVDDTDHGNRLHSLAEKALLKITRDLEITWVDEEFPKLLEVARNAPPDSAVLFLSHYELVENPTPRSGGRLQRFCDACPVPVYGVFDAYLGQGILGGTLVSGTAQGANAARIALRILRRELPENIPVVVDDLNRRIFDARRMRTLGIRESQLPPQSIVKFREPANAYIWAGAAFLALESLIIVALLVAAISRRRALRSLRENQMLLRDVVESADDPIFVKDLEGRYVLINSSDALGLGAKVHEVIGKTDADFFPPEVARRIIASDRHVIETGARHVYEAQFKKPDSTMRTYLVHKFPRKDADGQTIGVIGIGRDITERKRSELELQESEARWRSLVENAPNLICITGRDGTVRFSNRQPPTGAAPARPDWCVLDFIRPDDRPRAAGAIERAWNRLALVDFECRSVSPIEPPTWYSCRVAPITRDDQALGLIVVAHDITLKKVAEHALQKMLAELELRVENRTRELVDANRALRREVQRRRLIARKSRRHLEELAHVHRIATMGELATGIAHELNQPLAAISTFARGGIRRIDAGFAAFNDIREALQQISDQAQRAGEIIRGLRAFLQKEPGNRKPVDVNEAVREAAGMVASEARRASIELRLNLAEGLPPIQANIVQIEQVVLNLMRNSFDAIQTASSARREVRIRTRPHDASVLIIVEDTGPGFTPDSAARLCEPFYTTKSHGMGLGLSISRSIIEAHGGRLDVDAAHTGGARIILSIPAGDVAARRRLATSGAA